MHYVIITSHMHFFPLLEKTCAQTTPSTFLEGIDTCIQMQVDVCATNPILMPQCIEIDTNNNIENRTHLNYITKDKRHCIKKINLHKNK